MDPKTKVVYVASMPPFVVEEYDTSGWEAVEGFYSVDSAVASADTLQRLFPRKQFRVVKEDVE